MSRYIDADALKEKFINSDVNGISLAIDRYALKCIDDAPTIDIVFCKECKHWNDAYICWRRRTQPMAMNPDDFCSYGERKEGEQWSL